MIIKYFDWLRVSLMTNRDLWDTYQAYQTGTVKVNVYNGSLLLREIAIRCHCLDYLSKNRSPDAVAEILDIFSTYKLNGEEDEIC